MTFLDNNNAPQRRLSALGAGYSWFVKVAKLALPVAALVIVGIVFANLSENPVAQQITDLPATADAAAGQVELVSARYEGVDEKGQPYTVTADKAERSPNKDEVLLENPKGDLGLENKSWIAVHADKGAYNMESAVLNLAGNVRLFHDEGYEILTDQAQVDIRARTLRSDAPVQGQGPVGSLRARSMQMTDGGNLIVFGGPATLTLHGLKGKRG